MTTREVPREKAESVRMRDMFTTIAPRYDFITRLFSYGMDMGWKRDAVRQCGLGERSRVLDLACGTGDFARLVEEYGAQAIGADLTLRMMQQGSLRTPVCADAGRLPFADGSFDAVFIGYGVRNFPELERSLDEIRRVLRPGGTLATLDFFLPRNRLWRKLFLGYLRVQGAFWGLVLHGKPSIYTYIPRSLASFLTTEEYIAMLRRRGFGEVRLRPFLGGGIAVHWAVRPNH